MPRTPIDASGSALSLWISARQRCCGGTENVHLEVEAVVGDVGTLTEDLVAHKRTPDAHR